MDINDKQLLVPRGFNFDTLLRYVSRIIKSPIASYLIVHLLSQRLKVSEPKDKVAATAALWGATYVVIPGICKLTGRLLGFGPRPVKWSNEIVVVTGGSHGVGLELAKRLLVSGARVAIIDVNSFPIDDKRYNAQWKWYGCDITNLDSVKSIAGEIKADLGDPTMLVNNAGIVVGKPLLGMSDGEVDKVISVNLTAHFHLIRQLLPAMLKAKRGHILSVGSIVSHVGTPNSTTYCASKGGVKLLHESLKREVACFYGKNDVQFSIAYPGVTDTGLFHGLNLGQFFLPNLQPAGLARAMFEALNSGRGQEIYIPKIANLLTMIYALSPGVRTRLINTMGGGDQAMTTFSGHAMYK